MQDFGSGQRFPSELISRHSQFSYSGPVGSLVISVQQSKIVYAIVIETITRSYAHNKFGCCLGSSVHFVLQSEVAFARFVRCI